MTTTTPSPLPRRRFFWRLLAAVAGLSFPWSTRRASADTANVTPYLGEIMPVAFNFAPRGWALCNGQLLSISQNQALFSLLGTTYGGNGITTFALPDLRGRVPIHQGQGPGLTNRILGEHAGEDGHTLLLSEIPSHTHVARGSSATATGSKPTTTLFPARNAAGVPQWGPGTSVPMAAGAVSSTGGTQPHANQQPYLVINYVISLQGLFPMP